MMNNHNNSEQEKRRANSEGHHIGLLEELKEKIEKESWTNFIR